MRIACLCIVMVFLVSGCTTTGKVEQIIDAQVSPQIEQINAQLDGQKVAAAATLEDIKEFIDRLGRVLDADVEELQTALAEVEKEINVLEESSTGADADVSQLKASVVAVSDALDELKDSVKSIESSAVAPAIQ